MTDAELLTKVGIALVGIFIGYIWGYAACKNDKGGDDGTVGN